MGLYDNVLAQAREKEAMAAIDVPTSQATQYGAARGMARAKQGVNQMFGIEEPAVIQAKAAEARQTKLNSIVSKYANASTRADFTRAFSELMANDFPEHAAKIQEHLKNMPKPKEYSDIEGYKLAQQQGYEGTFVQYQIDLKKAQADSTTMLPTPAKGFMYEQDESGNWKSIVIPGGSADLEIQENTEKAKIAKINQQKAGNVVLKNVGLVRNAIANPQTFFGIEVGPTGFGALLKDIPATQAKGVAGMIDTIKGNVGFDKLQAMRDASPTGGALGQVSELELQLLMSTIGSLDQAQNEADLLRVLDEIEYWYNHIVHGAAYANKPPVEEKVGEPLNPDDPLNILT
jgi:hypothetical protein